ncbi:hypothetical protein FSP39_016871 [Pinctada imbricata]|uniref:Mab-21-like nucleotidyltransferase domain-containing protein n=1 Tax=Pinctada imbricata TaxID=66713 RepID=A0AA89BXI3_PINIB|nr:hypothetical protein FSP39_016871 [Pinctada imbricata]
MDGVPLYIAERVLISKGLYNLVSDIVGPECVVKSRRQLYAVKDALDNCTAKNENQFVIASGSKVEGFDFKSSDLDLMIVHTNMIVLRDTKFSALYTRKYPTVLVMETDCVPPGFTLLKFLKLDSNDTLVRIGTFTYRDGCMYMSNNVASRHSIPFHESTLHGPCRTYRTDGGKEIDYAITLRCSQWPEQATSFIQRSSQCGWPQFDILENICNDGCLFVPINSKQRKCRDTSDFEWRISFSVAEKKIIHTMNYCQFLCYGLSKILLKDVLKNLYGDNFLCSYVLGNK